MDALQVGEEHPVLHEDIIHAILDYLQDDKPALAICSLTSRAWTSPCRRHLFRDIAVAISPYKFRDRIEAFVGFLRDSYDARAYIQTLTFKADIYNPFPANLDVVAFRAILDTASYLRRFTLVDMFLTDEHSRKYTCAADTQPTVSLPHLAVSSNRKLTEEQYVTLLDVLFQTFAQIGTLELDVFVAPSTRHGAPLRLLAKYVDMAVFPAIDNLVFHPPSNLPLSSLYHMLHRSLISNRSPSSVSFHGTRGDHDEVRARVSEFCDIVIDGVRNVLRELEFHPGTAVFRRAVNASEVWNLPNLSQHHQLRTLTLPLECEDIPYSGEELTWMLDSHAHILLRYPPPSLERLVLKVRIPYNQDTLPYLQGYVDYLTHAPYRSSWAALDIAFSSLPSAPQVAFEFVGPWQGFASSEELERCMRELLPDTHKKGVLRVTLEKSFPRWNF
ncbi:hypothetical protein TRAPUB_6815 [Trametes pubescens]|uniref:F-box domain-containing protein n=1 Tax=Trametes pubescens TaxID=154538 RepID=A0A1M2V4V8_TRAPU|nr:hypothetical protein TRAPUB_6815 [Trametes pubescens]